MIKNLTETNYKDFFKKTLEERKLFNYPPFSELATLRYKNISQEKALEFI
jgi:primosomal protein N'